MDARRSFATLLLMIGFFGISNCQFSLSYDGATLFSIGEDASFECVFDPPPSESVVEMEVTWLKIDDDGESAKIARSYADSSRSFIYQNLREDVTKRFSTDSQYFEDGRAIFTIANITIEDASQYSCSVEADRKEQSVKFDINVFNLPEVSIELLETELDIRPPTPSPPANEMYNGDNVTDTTVDESDYEEQPTDPENPTVADPNVQIARCTVSRAYPPPSRVVFRINRNGDSIETVDGETEDSINNPDGTYNVVALLVLEPESELDGAILSCSAVVTDELPEASSDITAPITVLYPTNFIAIEISPRSRLNEGDSFTVFCHSNGNPRPTKMLVLPSNADPVDVTDEPYTATADRNMAGLYRCSTTGSEEDAIMAKEKKLSVRWMDAPIITGPEVGYEDEDVELMCDADSNMNGVTYEWYKDGAPISNGDSLRLRQVSADNSGSYECTASGVGVKTAQHNLMVKVGCDPIVEKHVEASPTKPGEAYVILTCRTSGNPVCNVEINRNNPNAIAFSDTIVNQNEAKVIIEALPKQMEPLKFTCTASNSFSSKSIPIVLDHEKTLGHQPSAGGVNGGVLVLIIIIVAFIAIGIPIAFCLLKRPRRPSRSTRSVEEPEEVKLNPANEVDS